MKNIMYLLFGLNLISCNTSSRYFKVRVELDTKTANTVVIKPSCGVQDDPIFNEKQAIVIEKTVLDSTVIQNETEQNFTYEMNQSKNRIEEITIIQKNVISNPQLKKMKSKSESPEGISSDDLSMIIVVAVLGLVFFLWLFGVITV